MINAGIEKLQDKKQSVAIRAMLTALAESISPNFVLKEAISCLKRVKSPMAHQEALPWFIDMVKDFGVVACGELLYVVNTYVVCY